MPKAPPGITKEKVRILRKQGKSLHEISMELGIGVSSVGRHCQSLGLTGISAKEAYRPSELVKNRQEISEKKSSEFKCVSYAKGYWAEALVEAELIKQGFLVSKPVFPISGTDFVVFREARCSRLEVKTAIDAHNKTGTHHFVQITGSAVKKKWENGEEARNRHRFCYRSSAP